jgi:hypothetical protein
MTKYKFNQMTTYPTPFPPPPPNSKNSPALLGFFLNWMGMAGIKNPRSGFTNRQDCRFGRTLHSAPEGRSAMDGASQFPLAVIEVEWRLSKR